MHCEFASVADSGRIEREAVSALPDLGELASRARRVVLLLAASDVTLLRLKVPPLAGARLKAALPNLVEDQLMSDPADCVMVAGEATEGLRTIAVVHRGWLELLAKTFTSLGARSIAAMPSQLCLPYQDDAASAAITEHNADADLTIRLAEQEGIGLPIIADQHELIAYEVMQTLCAVVPAAPVSLYVPQGREHAYQDAISAVPTAADRVTLIADTWPRWITGANKLSLDLMTGLGAAGGRQFNWRPWRWPIALAAAVLLINAIGLNVDWWGKKREATATRTMMTQTYRSAFPKDVVTSDPLAQMRQKMAVAQRESGQIAPDDFVALTSAFGEAWGSVTQGAQAIAGIEYRDRVLQVKLKPEAKVSMDQMRNALAARNLTLSQPSNGVWQIGSAK